MSQRETRAKVKKVEGRVKEAVGIVTGNSALEREGSRLRAEGGVQEKAAQARRKVGDLLEKAAKTIKE